MRLPGFLRPTVRVTGRDRGVVVRKGGEAPVQRVDGQWCYVDYVDPDERYVEWFAARDLDREHRREFGVLPVARIR